MTQRFLMMKMTTKIQLRHQRKTKHSESCNPSLLTSLTVWSVMKITKSKILTSTHTRLFICFKLYTSDFSSWHQWSTEFLICVVISVFFEMKNEFQMWHKTKSCQHTSSSSKLNLLLTVSFFLIQNSLASYQKRMSWRLSMSTLQFLKFLNSFKCINLWHSSWPWSRKSLFELATSFQHMKLQSLRWRWVQKNRLSSTVSLILWLNVWFRTSFLQTSKTTTELAISTWHFTVVSAISVTSSHLNISTRLSLRKTWWSILINDTNIKITILSDSWTEWSWTSSCLLFKIRTCASSI